MSAVPWHRALRALVLGAVVWSALLGACARPAAAHLFAPALLDVHESSAGVFDVHWTMPAEDFGAETLAPQFPVHCRWLRPLTVNAEELGEGRVDCGAAGLDGATVSVTGLEGSRLDVILRLTRSNGETITAALHSGASSVVIPAHAGTSPSVHTVLTSYVRLGIEHILTGYDHLLFVLGLILLVESWGMLLKTISAFTAAHSLTLALAVLGVVQVAPAPVEAMIALSILLLAVELARVPDSSRTLARRYPWLVAFVFGLLHGLGFAGALAQTGLPAQQITLALVAFNIGVELGQLMFVTAMIVPTRAFKRMRWPALRWVPAYAIGGIAAAWVIERVGSFWSS